MTVGERIKNARLIRNMKQRDLAEKLKVTASMIGQYECGIRNPKTKTLQKIADALDVSIDFLLGTTDVSTANTDLRQICDYTGLSEAALQNICEIRDHNITRSGEPLMKAFNLFLEDSRLLSLVLLIDSMLTCTHTDLNRQILIEEEMLPIIDSLENKFLTSFIVLHGESAAEQFVDYAAGEFKSILHSMWYDVCGTDDKWEPDEETETPAEE